MKIPIDYATVLARHPATVASIVAKLRQGKSVHRNDAPGALVWSYHWGLQVEAFTFREIMEGKSQDVRKSYDSMTPDEKLADRVSRSLCSIHANCGRWWGGEGLPDGVVPPELISLHWGWIEKKAMEQAEYDALSDQAKRDRFEKAYVELCKQPGFVSFLEVR